jgi:hypothetical protein
VFLGIVVAIIATISTKPIYASRAVVLDKDSPTNTDEVIRAAEYRINHPGDHGGY